MLYFKIPFCSSTERNFLFYKVGFALCSLLFCHSAFSQKSSSSNLFRKFYKTEKNESVFVPLGKKAFADSIIAFYQGNPSAAAPFNDPKQSLGEPDFSTYRTSNPNYVSIGCGGQLTVKFIDNGFIDIDGPDLVFFEIGPAIEPFRLEISSDGKKWYKLGHVDGGQSTVDIGKFIRPTAEKTVYHYVRITDLKHFCEGPTPGSDIDAIGAIGAVIKLDLNAALFFDTAQFALNKNAVNALHKLERDLQEIPRAKILINGHTDSDGGLEYNRLLGKNRANSVKNYLKSHLKNTGQYHYKIKSYGQTKPIKSNSSPEGKQQNRRVEVLIFPAKDFYKPDK